MRYETWDTRHEIWDMNYEICKKYSQAEEYENHYQTVCHSQAERENINEC